MTTSDPTTSTQRTVDAAADPAIAAPASTQHSALSTQHSSAGEEETKLPLAFFVQGYPYRLFGLIPTDRHLLGADGAEVEKSLFLLGTDLEGRDMWSRLMHATRISLSVGLASVALSLVLGVVLGGLSGFYGGGVGTLVQRGV